MARTVFCPREIKNHEYRVGLTPAGCSELTADGAQVLVEQAAGEGSGFSDDEYEAQGATMVASARQGYAAAELVVKVKEPQLEEFEYLREGTKLFCFLHLAAERPLLETLRKRRICALAYEALVDTKGRLPLLAPMSQVAGRLATLEGAHHLLRSTGGRGVLLPGVPGVLPAHVTVIGGGVVGTEAARMAAALGARVHVLDTRAERLSELSTELPQVTATLYSDRSTILRELSRAHLVIGAVLLRGARAPRLIQREDLKRMKPGAVLVDVAIDQGGIAESSRPTTHASPTYVEEGVVHYCVTNMPGAVGRSSTKALAGATLPYLRELARASLPVAVERRPELLSAVSTVAGEVTEPGVCESYGLSCATASQLIGSL